MKARFFKYILLVFILILNYSCNDFLEEVNPNELSTDNFWKTLDDCETGLISVYGTFNDIKLLSIEQESHRSDLTHTAVEDATNPYYNQTFTDASDGPNDKWNALYTGIFRTNQVIEGLSNLSSQLTTNEDIQRADIIMAQARFFRGLFYFYLHSSFNKGSVVIYKNVPKEESDFYKPLSPEEEVQEFFREDLNFAYENLPAQWQKDKGRVTAGAAASVLGTSYLYDKNYEIAALYFKDVIENADYGYALAPHVGDNFTTRNELNSESILEIVYSLNYKSEVNVWSDLQTANNLNFSFSRVGGWSLVYPSAWLIMAYKNDSIDINDPRNYVTDENGNTRLRKYSLRTSYSIALVDDPDLDYYGAAPAQMAEFNEKKSAYYRKYTNWDIVSNENDIVPNLRSGVNVRVIRLADIYLMYAECLIKGGSDESGVQEALKYINRVRKRSALQLLGLQNSGEYPSSDHDNKTYNAKMVMDHLMYVERPLELSVEGHAIRTIDLRRWGITRQRFMDLSQQIYHLVDFPYTKINGESDVRWQSILVEGGSSNTTTNVQDYIQAASNYNEEAHAYWPLPSREIIANPVLK
ncbi:MAG: RagB/SusD family nutrient uptake outer membrane protein [Bacteroidales bacterium]|nr:RagB/SusD family nutrient uptake outer membrane protein [Bacteroidales bacterium]